MPTNRRSRTISRSVNASGGFTTADVTTINQAGFCRSTRPLLGASRSGVPLFPVYLVQNSFWRKQCASCHFSPLCPETSIKLAFNKVRWWQIRVRNWNPSDWYRVAHWGPYLAWILAPFHQKPQNAFNLLIRPFTELFVCDFTWIRIRWWQNRWRIWNERSN